MGQIRHELSVLNMREKVYVTLLQNKSVL